MTNTMKLTDHFTFNEFTRTNRAEFQEENRKMAGAFIHNMISVCKELEKIRAQFARPVFITSGYRCPALNFAVGGAGMSQHLVGGAADIVVKDFQDYDGPKLIFSWAVKNTDYWQIILEAPKGRNPWIHFGIREFGKEPQALVWNGERYERA